MESFEHAILKESVKQTLEKMGCKVTLEKKIGKYEVDIYGETPQEEAFVFEVEVKKKADYLKISSLKALGLKVFIINAYEVITEEREKQEKLFYDILLLYSKGEKIGKISKRLGIPVNKARRWVMENNLPYLVSSERAEGIREKVEFQMKKKF